MEGVIVATTNAVMFSTNWVIVGSNVVPVVTRGKEGNMLELTVLDFWCVLGAGVLIGWGLACLGAWVRQKQETRQKEV